MPKIYRIRNLLATTLTLLTCACGGGGDAGAQTPPAPPPLVARGTWVVMGSSSAAGVGASPGQGWAALLATANAARQVTLQNIAVGGTLSYQALPTGSTPPAGRPAPDPTLNTNRALAAAPRLVLLSFPSNDVVAGIGAAETAANLQAMRSALQAGGAATLVLGTQPRDALTTAQRQSQADLEARLSTAFGSCLVTLQAALSDSAGNIAPAFAAGDGIHLNDAGHARVQQLVQAALDSGRCVRLAAG